MSELVNLWIRVAPCSLGSGRPGRAGCVGDGAVCRAVPGGAHRDLAPAGTMRLLLLLLALAAPAATSVLTVVKHNSIDDELSTPAQRCQPQTPCKWRIYSEPVVDPEAFLVNHYCSCSPGTACSFHFHRAEWGYDEYRCKPH
ncbi:hypothetical protein JYU34_006018 [Plutella xylostella]|uniref:Uncharacterized protein n=1 Tax=Plutella xylostella TaxID=51655 RepID=A0ABQ7QUP9_PLUXY|nr:hypothetical protein JYU34_006018 [Plutella xylostella]